MYEVNKESVCKAIYDTKIKNKAGKEYKALDFGKYILTSGKFSIMFGNHRVIMANPKNANVILGELQHIVLEDTGADHIISSADAGVYWGGIVANRLNLPFSVMRKDFDDKGLNKHMEVIPDYVMNVVPVDDLNTTLGTVNKVINVVHSLGYPVDDFVLSIDREEYTPKNLETFKEFGTRIHSLITMNELIEYGVNNDKLSKDKLELVEEYKKDPDQFALAIIQNNHDWVIKHPRLDKALDYYKTNEKIREALEELINKS